MTGLFLVALVIGYHRRLGMYDPTEALARSLLAAFTFGWVIGPYYLWLLWKAQRAEVSARSESGRKDGRLADVTLVLAPYRK